MDDADLIPPPWIADNLGFLLAKAGAVSTELFRDGLADLGIRPRHYSVLSVLHHRAEPITQQNVAGCLEIEPSSVVSVVDELERLGLVRREKDPADRRRNRLTVTEQGRETLARARQIAGDVESRLFGTYPDSRRDQLEQMLVTAIRAHHTVADPG